MNRTEYVVLRLNPHSENAWAVLSRSSGAIAESADGKLLIRLTKENAEQIANSLNAALPPEGDG